jgi:nucleoside-diphosphate-sugar epimerase
MREIPVAGAARIVRLHLVQRLLEEGDEVHALEDQFGKPARVHARAGDTALQRALGFKYGTSFEQGIMRATTYYSEPSRDSKPSMGCSVTGTHRKARKKQVSIPR